MAVFPLINGFYPSYADIVLKVDGFQIVGATDVSYDDDLKRSAVYGTQKVQLGLTNGKYVPNGSITLLLPAATFLLATLSTVGLALGGFRFVPFAVTVSYQPLGPLPLVTDAFECYLGKQEAKNKVSDDPSDRTFGLYLTGAILWNGSPGALDLNSIGAVA